MSIYEIHTSNMTASDFSAILNLYTDAGWIMYTQKPEMMKQAYRNSLLTLGAYDSDRLIGIIRTVGDGFSVVYVQDLLVLREYRRRGIGTQLLCAVTERFPSVYQTVLMTDDTPETVSFYRSAGFVKSDTIGCCAFIKP